MQEILGVQLTVLSRSPVIGRLAVPSLALLASTLHAQLVGGAQGRGRGGHILLGARAEQFVCQSLQVEDGGDIWGARTKRIRW